MGQLYNKCTQDTIQYVIKSRPTLVGFSERKRTSISCMYAYGKYGIGTASENVVSQHSNIINSIQTDSGSAGLSMISQLKEGEGETGKCQNKELSDIWRVS